MSTRKDQPEHRFSHWCEELLDRIMAGNCWWTAVDTGTQMVAKTDTARFAWENHRRWMGIKPHSLDWHVYQKDTGIYGQFELKIGKGKPTDGQETTMRLLRDRGIPTGCAWNLRQFYSLIVNAGFQVHADAANILAEVEARHAAARDAAKEKAIAAPKKPSRKPYAPRPSLSKIRRVEALRKSVLF